ncbi:hypothetical protein FXW78_36215 [Rhodococcus opacus]|nr:hypothetical protein [Rhodococcus opacus]
MDVIFTDIRTPVHDTAQASVAVSDVYVPDGPLGDMTEYVNDPGASRLSSEVRHFLAGRLPEFMVPAAVVVLDRLPLTVNGKLDRKRCRHRSSSWRVSGPASPVEETLASLYGDVLGLPRVGSTTVFFDLGGHSLSATRLVGLIRTALGVEVPIRVVFESRRSRSCAPTGRGRGGEGAVDSAGAARAGAVVVRTGSVVVPVPVRGAVGDVQHSGGGAVDRRPRHRGSGRGGRGCGGSARESADGVRGGRRGAVPADPARGGSPDSGARGERSIRPGRGGRLRRRGVSVRSVRRDSPPGNVVGMRFPRAHPGFGRTISRRTGLVGAAGT